MIFTYLLLPLLLVHSLPVPQGPWTLQTQFSGSPSDFNDRGKNKISGWWTPNTVDDTDGFPGAYSTDSAGGNNLFIDQQGYLVIQPTCPTHLGNGDCKAYQCGETMINGKLCVCDNTTVKNHWFPWWCQLGWGSAKIISQKSFNFNSKGSLFVFEDVWIPRGKPLWPAIWLLPATNPVYGGTGSPKGGTWTTWPNNGELDILESVGIDPRIYGTLHYSCGNEFNGWPGIPVTANNSAQQGTAYIGAPLSGNILATRSAGDNPLPDDGHLATLSFAYFIDDQKGPTLTWLISDGIPVGPDGQLNVRDQLDVMINRVGTDPLFGNTTGDGSGTISFGTTPYWPGSKGNSPPLTLYKGWDGKQSYGYQGYYPVQGNVKTATIGIHDGQISAANPKGLGVVPQFDSEGKPIPGTIAELYEPYLCSLIGSWANPLPLPWDSTACQNPPPGDSTSNCPMTGAGKPDTYDYCWVEGASRPGLGWWSNSPMSKGVPYAPFDPSQNWNIVLNVAIGGLWPRGAGQEGDWGMDFEDLSKTNLRMKSISYYEIN